MIIAIVQARCSSTRLPGKVLAPVAGAPMIIRQLERVERATMIDNIVVATSVEASDDPLADLIESTGRAVRRGPLQDVAARFAQVADEFAPDHIVRLTADCPVADHAIIDRVVGEHLASGADYTSNVMPRTYPRGLDVECISTVTFERMMQLDLTEPEREHVTMGIYSRPSEFVLHNVVQSDDSSNLRWTVDLPEDLEFVRAVYDALYADNPDFTQEDILNLLARAPHLTHLEK